MRSERLRDRAIPVLTVVAAIIAVWYLAAVTMNAPFQRDLDRRAEVTSTTMEFIGKTLAQPKPIVPAPHQVVANVFENTFMRKVTSNRSLVYHSWVTLSSTLAGFGMGTLLGILIAVGIVHVKALDRSLPDRADSGDRADGGGRAVGDQRLRADPQGANFHLPFLLPRRRRNGEGPAFTRPHASRPDAHL
jgi:hypothetical protein